MILIQLFQHNILVTQFVPSKNQLTRDFEQAEKDAFKQENPDLEIFEQMGAGALAKAVVMVM